MIVSVAALAAWRPNQRLVAELHAAAVLEKPFPIDAVLRLVEEWSSRHLDLELA